MPYLKIQKLKIKNSITLAIVVALLFSYLVVPVQRAKAGLIIKLPSNLGLSTNLVGHWTMDATDISWTDGNIQDRSTSGNKGAFQGAMGTTTAPTLGKIGQALKFDGSDDAVNIGSPSVLSITGEMSISVWIKTIIPGSGRRIIFSGTSALSKEYFSNLNTSSQINGGWGGSTILTGNTTIITNRWYHVVLVRSGSSGNWTASIYVDGVLDNTTTTATDPTTGGTVVIGASDISNAVFTGPIDDVRIYSRVLSADEIKRLYNMGGTLKIGKTDTTSLTTNLVGHWTFDAVDLSWTDGHAYDKSGNNNTGDFLGGMSTTTSPTLGKIGQALKFKGNNITEYVSLPNTVLNSATNVTTSFWLRTSRTGAQAIISGANSVDTNNHMVYFPISTQLQYFSTGSVTFTINSIADNAWHHIVVLRDDTNNNVYLYIDGVADNENPLSLAMTTLTIDSGGLVLGQEQDTVGDGFDAAQALAGTLDDVRVYNRVLSADEIKRLYNMGGTLKIGKTDTTSLTTNLVGHWTMDASDISWTDGNIQDRSGNGNKGAFQGMGTTTAPTLGKIGQALKFDASNDLINAGNPTVLNDLGPMTISAWINPRSNGEGGNNGLIITKSANTGELGRWELRLQNRFLDFNKRFSTNLNRVSGTQVDFNTWQHILLTWDGGFSASEVHMYKNGSEVSYGGSSNGAGAQSDASLPLVIGNNADGAFTFDGSIDDVRVYSRVLSAAEIQRLYQMGR